ncbi:MAG: Fpg/Nei family DNA glycosylase [Archaeoglobaceae archaeon]
MPELPEVEVFRQYMDNTSLDQTIQNVEVKNSLILEDTTPGRLRSWLMGKKFHLTHRYGKYLFAKASQDLCLVMHFGMTGHLRYLRQSEEAPDHTRLLFWFNNGNRLAYVCQRMLGRVGVVESVDQFIHKKHLGSDALNMNIEEFKELMRGRKGRAKSILMNQKIIAGIGNIYSDEILYQTGVHPETRISDLSEEAVEKLFENIVEVLSTAVNTKANFSELPPSYLIPHRYKGGKCPLCGEHLKSLKLSGRTVYFCPRRQQRI